MQVEQTDISDVKKRLAIDIPQDVVASQMTEIAREFAKRARVPGFRPGRAPLGVIKNRYRDDLLSELYQQLLPRYFSEALKERELSVVEDSAHFEPPEYRSGEPLRFDVTFEVFPEFELADYSEIPVEEVSTEVSEDEVDTYFQGLADEHAEMIPIEEERPLASGDFAEVSFSASIAGEDDDPGDDPESLSREKALCEVGGENTLGEFTDHLMGARVGDELRFEVVYPDDHPDPRLKGRTVRYVLQVEGIKEKRRPELDDDFAKELGEYESFADLRNEVRENMEAHRREHAEQQKRDQILRWLEQQNEFEVPDSLVEQQVQSRLERLARNLAGQGVRPQSLDIDWNKVRADQYSQAVRDVRGLLILEHLAEKEKVTVSDEDVEDEIEKMAKEMQQPIANVREVLGRNDGLTRIRSQIRHNKTLTMLEAHAKIVPSGTLAKPGEDTGSEEGPAS